MTQVLRHLVSFKWKDGTSEEEVVFAAFVL